MDISGGNYHHPGAQDEPFFDLLQQSAPIAASKTGYSNSAYNAPKKMEHSPDFTVGGDDVLPSFDFQPIRTSAPSSSSNASGGSSSSAVRIEESRQGSPPSSYTSYEPMVRRSREPPPTYDTPVSRSQEYEKESFDSATAAAVERTMKKYADNLLRVLEGMTGRLSNLESSTQRLEHLCEKILNMVGDNHGEADRKLRSLESHMLEVQRGVQLLRDRQEIFEAQSQLAKLQMTAKGESTSLPSAPSAPPPPPAPAPGLEAPRQLDLASSAKALVEASQLQVSDTPTSSYYQPPLQLQQMPSLPVLPSQQPQPAPQQPPPRPKQQQHHEVQQQLLQIQQQAVLQNDVSLQTLQQQSPPPPSAQQLSHLQQHQPQPPHQPAAYSQQPPQQQQSSYTQQQQQPPQPPPMPSYGPPPELPAYGQHPQGLHLGSHHLQLSTPNYPSDLPSYHPSYGPPRPVLPPPQQHPPPSSQTQQPHNVGMFESSMGRGGSGQLSLPALPYLPQGQPGSGLPHYESQGMNPGSGYAGSSYRVAQPVPSAPTGGNGGYPRLPVAQPLPHSLPTGGGVAGPPAAGNPSLSTNRVPIDEVIDKVTAMGFSKDQVRAVVRRLTENGQSVDLNIVLDKLMNGDSAQGPPKGGWFGR